MSVVAAAAAAAAAAAVVAAVIVVRTIFSVYKSRYFFFNMNSNLYDIMIHMYTFHDTRTPGISLEIG
jgi:hypothetical protein